jgi:hypothetical protein
MITLACVPFSMGYHALLINGIYCLEIPGGHLDPDIWQGYKTPHHCLRLVGIR